MKDIYFKILWRWRFYQLCRMMTKFNEFSRSSKYEFLQYLPKIRRLMSYSGVDLPDFKYETLTGSFRAFPNVLNMCEISKSMMESANILSKLIK